MREISGYKVEQLTTVTVIGNDAPKFLQGQCTQDINGLVFNQAQAAAFCTAKGRAITNVWITKVNAETPTFQLLCHQSSAEHLLTHLRKYAAFFRGTTLSCATEQFSVLGLAGDTSEQLCQSIVQVQSGEFYGRLPDGRCLLWLSSARADDIEIEGIDVWGNADEWAELDIRNKVLWLDANQIEAWVPQNFSLDLLDGISFKKGCYTGQEVIARLHYKGQSKKRLYAVTWPGISPAQKLFQDGKAVGDVIAQVQIKQHSFALAIIKTEAAESPLYQDETQQVQIELLQ